MKEYQNLIGKAIAAFAIAGDVWWACCQSNS
jgi:hypothetical protein